MDLEKRIECYDRFSRLNDESLCVVAGILGNDQQLAEGLEKLFFNLDRMLRCIYDLYSQDNAFAHGLTADEFDRRLTDKILDMRFALQGMMSNPACKGLSPAIHHKLMRRQLDAVCGLNPKLEGRFMPDDVRLSDLHTPHDLIRYLHTVATEMLFCPGSGKWDMRSVVDAVIYNQGGMAFSLVGYGGVTSRELFDSSPFISRFRRIGDSSLFFPKQQPMDYFQMFGSRSILSSQQTLGCHYATMQVRSDDPDYHIHFRFVDTVSYESSRFRTDVTRCILERLGHSVSGSNNMLAASSRLHGLDAALASYESLLRMSVSLADLDMCKRCVVDGRSDDIVDAFMHGVLKLAEYAQCCQCGTYAQYASECDLIRKMTRGGCHVD